MQSPSGYLSELYLDRRKKNPSYSISAFARDIYISVSLLSRILSEKRPLTLKQGLVIAAALNMNREQTQRWSDLIVRSSGPRAKIPKKLRDQCLSGKVKNPLKETLVDADRFASLSNWTHLALLNLISTEGFKLDWKWIGARLEISPIEARSAFERLSRLKLVENKGGRWRRTHAHLSIKTTQSKTAVREFHRQMIGKSLLQLEKVSDEDFSKRLINSITISVRKDRVEWLKERINQFQDEILETIGTDLTAEEVYQLNVQLFPLSSKIV